MRLLETGIPHLDRILGGGLPAYSFNLIVGEPGAGKTTLAHQIMFANASPEHPALYFTILGEPPLKMLRYQQQLGFFDPDLLKASIRFINLSEEAMRHDLKKVQERIIREVEHTDPAIVVVDSFRTMMRSGAAGQDEVRNFVQQLALYLTSWQATTFLVGEYNEKEWYYWISACPIWTAMRSPGACASRVCPGRYG